jgi:hypothetical protein
MTQQLSLVCLRTFSSLSINVMITLAMTLSVSSALVLSSPLFIQALASLTAIQPILWQAVDQGTRPAAIPIRLSSSFLNPFDGDDEVRLLLTSNSIPPNAVSLVPNPVRLDRANPIVTAGLQVRSESFPPGAYVFTVQAIDEDGNKASSAGCLIIRPTNRTSCPLPPTPPLQQPSQQPALTGVWQANDGGTYYLRQIENVLWWNGMSGGNDGRTFNNVFKGTITSTTGTIIGDWTDVPRGTVMGYGTLSLKITNPTTIQKVSQTGSGFGATTWQKVR